MFLSHFLQLINRRLVLSFYFLSFKIYSSEHTPVFLLKQCWYVDFFLYVCLFHLLISNSFFFSDLIAFAHSNTDNIWEKILPIAWEFGGCVTCGIFYLINEKKLIFYLM